jgi:PTS system mannose-specific IIB component
VDFALVRVDNRLVHGQILEAWLPYIKASCIVVADDDVANDFFRETVIKMAVPREVEVLVYSIEEFSKTCAYGEINQKKAILLYSTIENALRSYDLGFRFKRLNIGNVYSDDARIRCAASILLSEKDIHDIQILSDAGVIIECRCVPRDKSLDSKDFLKKRI